MPQAAVLASADWAMWGVLLTGAGLLVAVVFGIPSWLTWWSGRQARQDAAEARALALREKSAVEEEALQAHLQPSPLPHEAYTDRKVRVGNAGTHSAAVTYFEVWNGDENGAGVRSGGQVSPALEVAAGDQVDIVIHGLTSGPACCRARWFDGRTEEQEREWRLDLPESRGRLGPRSPLR